MLQKITAVIISAMLSFSALFSGTVIEKIPTPLIYPILQVEAVEDYNVSITDEDVDSVTLQKHDDGAFKVLLYTDMHLDGRNVPSYRTVDRMVQTIQSEQPDLVLLGGDNVTSGLNRVRCRQLACIFEKLGVYWGGVIGNHEGDNVMSVSRDRMVDIFASYPHCIMRKGPKEIDGSCNYAIHLLGADGKHVETIFCLDTFDEISDEIRATHDLFEKNSPYDGAHENQVQWYREKAAALKATFGDYKSILLEHIPLHAYDVALESEPLCFGEQRENCCSTVYENGLFDAVKASGTTQAIFSGHDHLNNFGVMYEGILLAYIEPSGYSAYGMDRRGAPEKDWLQGYTVLQIQADGTFEHSQVRYAEVFGD